MSQYLVVTPQGEFGPTDFQTLVQWASEGRVAPGMTVRDVLSGQVMSAASVPGLFEQVEEEAYSAPASKRDFATIALTFGIIGMVAWCLPIVGFPVATTAIILGLRSLKGPRRARAQIAIVLGLACLVLCILNMVLVTLLVDSIKHMT